MLMQMLKTNTFDSVIGQQGRRYGRGVRVYSTSITTQHEYAIIPLTQLRGVDSCTVWTAKVATGHYRQYHSSCSAVAAAKI
jgi:hypothetical protein